MWSGALQLLQSSPTESVARSQWPRAAHSGLMHCTVHPGKYCTLFPPLWNHALLFPFAVNRSQLLLRVNQSRSPDQKPTEKVAGSVRRLPCGVKEKDTIPSGMVAVRDTTCQTVLAAGEEIPEEMFFPPLQPFRACPQSVLPSGETKGQNVFVCGKEYGS